MTFGTYTLGSDGIYTHSAVTVGIYTLGVYTCIYTLGSDGWYLHTRHLHLVSTHSVVTFGTYILGSDSWYLHDR